MRFFDKDAYKNFRKFLRYLIENHISENEKVNVEVIKEIGIDERYLSLWEKSRYVVFNEDFISLTEDGKTEYRIEKKFFT